MRMETVAEASAKEVEEISSKTTTLRMPMMPTERVDRLTKRLAGVALPPLTTNTWGEVFLSRKVLPVCRGPSSIRLRLRSTSGRSRARMTRRWRSLAKLSAS